MNAKNCKVIRQQIDEANLDDHLTLEANEHLRNCVDCRCFHDERRELRGLMAGLETIGAPADFDFRLRARLAREKSRNGFGSFLLTARPIGAAALVILIAVVAVVVRSRMSPARSPEQTSGITSTGSPTIPTIGAPPADAVAQGSAVLTANHEKASKALVATSEDKQGNSRPRTVAVRQASNSSVRNVRAQGTREFSLESATVVSQSAVDAVLVVVPVDGRAFKVSIDDGRGGARTISLPPFSFGSQRLLARDASFVPVSSGKGDW
jgi:hypothetical protein